MEPQVFISYTRSDSPSIESYSIGETTFTSWIPCFKVLLEQRLRTGDKEHPAAGNIPVYFDEGRLKPGQHLDSRIQAALEKAKVLIALMSGRQEHLRNGTNWPADERKRFLTLISQGANKRIIPVLLDDCEAYLHTELDGYWPFRAEAFRDIATLASRVVTPRRELDRWLSRQLSEDTRGQLRALLTGSEEAQEAARRSLQLDFNRIRTGEGIYDARRFHGTRIRRLTQQLIDKSPQGVELMRLNRLLIEDAYPDEIDKGEVFFCKFYEKDPVSDKITQLGYPKIKESFLKGMDQLADAVVKGLVELEEAEACEVKLQANLECACEVRLEQMTRSEQTELPQFTPVAWRQGMLFHASATAAIVCLMFAALFVEQTSFYLTLLAVVHFLSSGMQSYVMRTASNRLKQRESIIFFSSLITYFLSTGLILIGSEWVPAALKSFLDPGQFWWVVFVFMVVGLAYFLVNLARLEAQRELPSYIFEPASRWHVMIVLPLSMYALEGSTSRLEWFSLVPVLLAVFWIGFLRNGTPSAASPRSGAARRRWGWAGLLAASGVVAAGLQLLTSILMTESFPVMLYVMLSNFASMFFATLVLWLGGHERRGGLGSAAVYGCLVGVLNFITLSSMLLFLIRGKASQIYSASALSMVIPVALTLTGSGHTRPSVHQSIAFAFAIAAFVFQSAVRQ